MIQICELSSTADKDLENIFDYSLNAHGLHQAFDYVSSFDEIFELLIINPKLGRERSEIRVGLRSLLKEYHVVFYRILKDRIRIVRILHVAQDVPKNFKQTLV